MVDKGVAASIALTVSCLVAFLVYGLVVLLPAFSVNPNLGQELQGFPLKQSSLDDLTSMLFFGRGNRVYRWEDNNTLPLDVYDPSRPLLFFLDGWNPGMIEQRYFTTGNYTNVDGLAAPDGTSALFDAWKDAGWNVLFFHWARFNDEPNVDDAATKLWRTDGPLGMRWRDNAGGARDYPEGETLKTVPEMCVDKLSQVLADHANESLWMGSSLGCQMAPATLDVLMDRVDAGDLDAALLPEKLVFADPYVSTTDGQELYGFAAGETVADRVAAIVDRLRQSFDVPTISLWTSSLMPRDARLAAAVVAVKVLPAYFNRWYLLSKHVCGAFLVWGSVVAPEPSSAGEALRGALAFLPREEALELVGTSWEMTAGGGTFDAADDAYTPRAYEDYANNGTIQEVFLGVIIIAAVFVVGLILNCYYCVRARRRTNNA